MVEQCVCSCGLDVCACTNVCSYVYVSTCMYICIYECMLVYIRMHVFEKLVRRFALFLVFYVIRHV